MANAQIGEQLFGLFVLTKYNHGDRIDLTGPVVSPGCAGRLTQGLLVYRAIVTGQDQARREPAIALHDRHFAVGSCTTYQGFSLEKTVDREGA